MLVDGLVAHLARSTPKALVVAMRRARLVRSPGSAQVDALRAARKLDPLVDEACRIHDVLVGAHREREVELARWQRMLENLSAFELLLLHGWIVDTSMDSAGFTAKRFVSVVEGEMVWEQL